MTPPNSISKLPHPFPRHASPDKRPRIALYAHYPHDPSHLPPNHYRRIIVQVFSEPYAALAFVTLFLRVPDPSGRDSFIQRPHRWLDHNSILIPDFPSPASPGGAVIKTRPSGPRSPTLEDIMEYEPTPTESHYQLPLQVQRQPFLLTRPFQTTLTIDPEDPQPEPLMVTDTRSSSRTRTRTSAPRLDKTGLVHVSVIATSLSITPREARQALRTSKTPKPKGGWYFSPDQVEHFTSIIKKHLKPKK